MHGPRSAPRLAGHRVGRARTPNSACSRPARRRTSTWSAGRCRTPTGPACWRRSATGTPEHRLFHRDAGYLEGRRVRRSRENRAMAGRTAFGRQMIAGQWAAAEFAALCPALGDRRRVRADRRAVPGAAARHRADAGVRRGRRRGTGRAPAGPAPPGAGRAARPVGAAGRRAGRAGPGRLRPRRPVRRTTCWCTGDGW